MATDQFTIEDAQPQFTVEDAPKASADSRGAYGGYIDAMTPPSGHRSDTVKGSGSALRQASADVLPGFAATVAEPLGGPLASGAAYAATKTALAPHEVAEHPIRTAAETVGVVAAPYVIGKAMEYGTPLLGKIGNAGKSFSDYLTTPGIPKEAPIPRGNPTPFEPIAPAPAKALGTVEPPPAPAAPQALGTVEPKPMTDAQTKSAIGKITNEMAGNKPPVKEPLPADEVKATADRHEMHKVASQRAYDMVKDDPPLLKGLQDMKADALRERWIDSGEKMEPLAHTSRGYSWSGTGHTKGTIIDGLLDKGWTPKEILNGKGK